MHQCFITTEVFKKLLLSFFVISVLIACNKKEKEEEPDGPATAETKKGFHYSTERPVGNPFVLPAGVTIADKIKGYSVFTPEYCDNKTEDDAQGVGSMVRVCVPFFNNNSFAVTITCPQGLVFIARQAPGTDSTRIQNGILVEQANFSIPGKTLFYLPLYLICLNSGRQTSSPMFEYEMGPVTIDKDMLDLFAILNKKKLSKDPYLAAAIQGAVWDVTRGDKLSQADLDIIAAQPNR